MKSFPRWLLDNLIAGLELMPMVLLLFVPLSYLWVDYELEQAALRHDPRITVAARVGAKRFAAINQLVTVIEIVLLGFILKGN